MPDIAIYIQGAYAKPTYKTESYNVRIWPGIEMVKHDLERNGLEVGYCNWGTVDQYRLILASITSAIDWYSFIQERVKWPKGNYKVLVGGAGVDNVRPFLEYADAFFLGRAEGAIPEIARVMAAGGKAEFPFLINSEDFSPDKEYPIRMVAEPYPHAYQLSNGKKFQEKAIGCQRKCLFCQYSWTRKFVGLKRGGVRVTG